MLLTNSKRISEFIVQKKLKKIKQKNRKTG